LPVTDSVLVLNQLGILQLRWGQVTDDQNVQNLVREKVWTELRKVGRPDSRFHWDFSSFIADFEGSEEAALRLTRLTAWKQSSLFFIAPDNSTEPVRRKAIEEGKSFLMTTYGIRRGFLLLRSGVVPKGEERYAATLDGMDRYATPISLSEIKSLGTVGLLVTGGSGVTRAGLRVGKGHGFFDVECAILSELGVMSDQSVIADIVHDCQIVDIVVEATPNDVGVHLIVTPTQTLEVDSPVKGPGRILWELIPGTEFDEMETIHELARLTGHTG